MTTQTFEVGDVVSFGGEEGKVVEMLENHPYPLVCEFPDVKRFYFLIDGRFAEEHTEPLLKLVSRPKKMVKKTIERWVNIYPGDGNFATHSTEESADRHALESRVTCVKLTGSCEVYE